MRLPQSSIPGGKVSLSCQLPHPFVELPHVTAPIAGPSQWLTDEDITKKRHQNSLPFWQCFAQPVQEQRSHRHRRIALGQPRDAAFKTLHVLRLAPASLGKHNEQLAVCESLVARRERIVVASRHGSFDRQNTDDFHSEPRK